MLSLVKRYLDKRRAGGVALQIDGRQLRNFAIFADKVAPGKPLTSELAVLWARSSTRCSPVGQARRIEVVRPFARYLSGIYPDTQIPPVGLLGPSHPRQTPHIYSNHEIEALLSAAEGLNPTGGLWPRTIRTYLGILICTGMRPREPLRLSQEDVDLHRGIVTVRKTKFRKTRIVPLHESANRALRTYAQVRDKKTVEASSSNFFLIDGGLPLTARKLRTAFDQLREQLQWKKTAGRPAPRLYDLRHTFVCRRLATWYAEGTNVHQAIGILATYLGHVKVSDTYWYLTAIPELMAVVSGKFERFAEGDK